MGRFNVAVDDALAGIARMPVTSLLRRLRALPPRFSGLGLTATAPPPSSPTALQRVGAAPPLRPPLPPLPPPPPPATGRDECMGRHCPSANDNIKFIMNECFFHWGGKCLQGRSGQPSYSPSWRGQTHRTVTTETKCDETPETKGRSDCPTTSNNILTKVKLSFFDVWLELKYSNGNEISLDER